MKNNNLEESSITVRAMSYQTCYVVIKTFSTKLNKQKQINKIKSWISNKQKISPSKAKNLIFSSVK